METNVAGLDPQMKYIFKINGAWKKYYFKYENIICVYFCLVYVYLFSQLSMLFRLLFLTFEQK